MKKAHNLLSEYLYWKTHIVTESRHSFLQTNNSYLVLVRSFENVGIFLKNQLISHMKYEIRSGLTEVKHELEHL